MIRYAPYIDGTIPAFTNDGIIVPFQHNPAVGEGAAASMILKIKDLNGNTLGFLRTNIFNSNQAIFDQWAINYEIKEEVLQQCDFNGDGVIDMEDALYLLYHVNYKETYPLAKDTNPDIDDDKELTVNDAIKLMGFFQHSLLDKLEVGQYYKIQLSYIDEFELPKNLNSLVYSSIGVTKYIGSVSHEFNKEENKFIFSCSDLTEKIFKEENKVLLDGVEVKNELLRKGFPYTKINTITTVNKYYSEKSIVIEKDNDSSKVPTLENLVLEKEYGEVVLPSLTDPLNNYFIRVNSIDDKNYSIVKSPDNTVEHGKTYYYGVIDNDGNWTEKKQLKPISIDFEDMFLQDAEHTLCVKFNPKISNFKRTIQESKVTTLENKYPFFFRNGYQDFAEFSINGLISYYSQDSGKFVQDQDIGLKEDDKNRTTNLVGYNIHAEKKYRDLVYNWLNNGKPKLFRSPTEGNFIVRLMDVNLTPEDQLGRMLYSFSCSATECAAADDYTALEKNNLV